MSRDTEDLIDALARHGTTASTRSFLTLPQVVMLGMLPAGAIFFVFFGFRSSFAESAANPYFILRGLFLVVLTITSLSLIPQLGRPGALVQWPRLLWGPLVLASGLLIERVGWIPDPTPVSAPAWVCISGIAGLAAFPMIALLLALRNQAATQPGLAGAIAGLAGGAMGATLYALWCVETSPSYVALWYGLALVLCSATGALVGRQLLRW